MDSDVTATWLIPGGFKTYTAELRVTFPSDPADRGTHIPDGRKGLPQNEGPARSLLSYHGRLPDRYDGCTMHVASAEGRRVKVEKVQERTLQVG